jgi:hypothetical protein
MREEQGPHRRPGRIAAQTQPACVVRPDVWRTTERNLGRGRDGLSGRGRVADNQSSIEWFFARNPTSRSFPSISLLILGRPRLTRKTIKCIKHTGVRPSTRVENKRRMASHAQVVWTYPPSSDHRVDDKDKLGTTDRRSPGRLHSCPTVGLISVFIRLMKVIIVSKDG